MVAIAHGPSGARIGLVNVTLRAPWSGHPTRRSQGNVCRDVSNYAHSAGLHRVGVR